MRNTLFSKTNMSWQIRKMIQMNDTLCKVIDDLSQRVSTLETSVQRQEKKIENVSFEQKISRKPYYG